MNISFPTDPFMNRIVSSLEEFSVTPNAAVELLQSMTSWSASPAGLPAAAEDAIHQNSHPAIGYQPDQGVYVGSECNTWTSGDDWHIQVEFTELEGKPQGWFYLPAGSELQRTFAAAEGVFMAAGVATGNVKLFVEGRSFIDGFPRSIVTAMVPYAELSYDEIFPND
jgi:hypothetical protein